MKLIKILPVIGVALFVYIIWTVGVENIALSLINADFVLIGLSVLIILPFIILQTQKWRLILLKQGIFLNFSYLFKVQVIGIFYALITPARLGSFIKIHYIRKGTDVSLGKVSSSVVIDRIFDIITLTVLALVGMLMYINYFFSAFLTILVLFLASLVMIAIFFNKNRSRRFLMIIYSRLMPLRYKAMSREAFHSFYDNIPGCRQLVKPFLYSIVNWVLISTHLFMVALAFGISIPYLHFIFIIPISTIIALVPITVGGFGVREISLIGLFSMFAVSAENAVAYSIFSTVLYLLFVFICFLIIINFSSVKKLEETE